MDPRNPCQYLPSERRIVKTVQQISEHHWRVTMVEVLSPVSMVLISDRMVPTEQVDYSTLRLPEQDAR